MASFRIGFVGLLACAALMVMAPGTSSALVAQGGDGCDAFTTLQSDVQSKSSIATFDAKELKSLSKSFKKASKTAPKQLKAALKQLAKTYKAISKAGSESEAEQAVSDGLEKFQAAYAKLGEYVTTNCSESGSSGSASGSSGGSGRGGTLTLGTETIALDSARCYLEEQTSAGQKIELTGQGFGTNSAGVQVVVDFTRYAAGGRFEGDDVNIDIGPPGSPDFMSYSARLDIGGVDRNGSTLSANDIEVRDEDFQTTTASFELRCG